MSWTDERVELLRRLWLEGLSASRIAAELSDGITRNAVIGKVHRLGLSGRVKAPSTTASVPREREARPAAPKPIMTAVHGNLALKPMPVQAVVTKSAEDVVIPFAENVTIMELREAMCRWPVGDPSSPDFRFCGGKRNGGSDGPYCAHHAKIAYQPAMDRRRDRDRMQRVG
jgi:GcrA cell cycle regulator